MTDEKFSAGGGRDLAADGSPRGRWARLVAHRWPTALGVAVAALTAFDLEGDAGFVTSLSALVVVMALVYVGGAGRWRSSSPPRPSFWRWRWSGEDRWSPAASRSRRPGCSPSARSWWRPS